MIDFSWIGKNGLIVDYEDIISMTGFNVVKYLRQKKFNDKMCKMSIEDILLSYINRSDESIPAWLDSEFGISGFRMEDYLDSRYAFQPNLLYTYRVFLSAYENGVRDITVHSTYDSSAIKSFLKSYQVDASFSNEDIVSLLSKHENCTYITSSPSNIRKCLNVKCPFALTICDDYMYVASVLKEQLDTKLRKNNVYVAFTSILSAGFV